MGVSDSHYCPLDSSEGASFGDGKRLFINQCNLDKHIPCFSTSVLGSQTSVCKRANQIGSWAELPEIPFQWDVDEGFTSSKLSPDPSDSDEPGANVEKQLSRNLRFSVQVLAHPSLWLNSWQFPGYNYGMYGFQGNMHFVPSTY